MQLPGGNGNGGRDQTFLKILVIFGSLLLLVGAAAVLLSIVGDPSDKVIFRITGALGSMFSGMLGLAIGYLTGRGK